jgi:putative transposase
MPTGTTRRSATGFIADELADLGISAGENRVQRLCSSQRIWSVFAKKRGLNRKAGPPVHDDLVSRDFTASHRMSCG